MPSLVWSYVVYRRRRKGRNSRDAPTVRCCRTMLAREGGGCFWNRGQCEKDYNRRDCTKIERRAHGLLYMHMYAALVSAKEVAGGSNGCCFDAAAARRRLLPLLLGLLVLASMLAAAVDRYLTTDRASFSAADRTQHAT